MRRWFLLALLILIPGWIRAETPIPPRPRARIADEANVFDAASKARFSQLLEDEHSRYRVSVYVATFRNLSKSESVSFANRLRAAWITDELGLVVLYAENTDKISISLSKPAYKLVALSGQLEKLASDIDVYNEKGPKIGLQLAVDAILDRVRIKQTPIPTPPPGLFRQKVLKTSAALVFAFFLFIGGCFIVVKLIIYCNTHNVFTPRYVIKTDTVKPILGSAIGGVNTSEEKY